MFYKIDESKCVRCGSCANNCPSGAIHAHNIDEYYIDESMCFECAICYYTCPYQAIEEK